MSDWKDRIKQWASDRNLIEGSSPFIQLGKLSEECDELSFALLGYASKGLKHDIKDAIGDIQVVLAVMCAQLGIDVDECREIAWEQIKDRKGKMVDGVFVKEVQGE
jgi:NTP pyrophosphatase (non-canonical NTP hydrolase)